MPTIRKGKGDVYSVVCPFCHAPINVRCSQVSYMRRTGKHRWIMHQSRKNLVEEIAKSKPE